MKSLCSLVLVLLLCWSNMLINMFVRAEVVELTDATFEHETQASTGMTTGSWFILFKAENCPHCLKAMPDFEMLSNDDELHGIVFSTINVPSNRATSTRFGIRGFPSLLYLHKHKVYHVKGKRTATAWKHFLTEGIHEAEGLPIPPPLTPWTQFVKTLQAAGVELYDAATGKSGTEGYFILLMVFVLIVIFGSLIAMCFMPPVQHPRPTNAITKKKQ